MTTSAFTGLPTNMLRPSILAAGLEPENLEQHVSPERSTEMFGANAPGPRRWQDVWSAGHSVSGVREIGSVRELIAQVEAEYAAARDAARALLSSDARGGRRATGGALLARPTL
jgi:nitronate monooxygenase